LAGKNDKVLKKIEKRLTPLSKNYIKLGVNLVFSVLAASNN